LKAKAQQATADAAQEHADMLKTEVEKANAKLMSLAEKEEGKRALVGRLT
jgi:hypothetical protein